MLTDLDLDLPVPGVGAPKAKTASKDQDGVPAPLEPGSVTAQALYGIWSGSSKITIVDSPPGAGKSELVATVAAHLATRSDLSVCIATNTRAQALDIAGRVAKQMDPGSVFVLMKGVDPSEAPYGVRIDVPSTRLPANSVAVRTVAFCTFQPPAVDVLIIDEAYQSTFADAAEAADAAGQVLLVGDPGQIGPVVTCRTSTWERRAMAPHRRAPEVFGKRDDATLLRLDRTWRLGADTVRAISPLYGFEFVSARSRRELVGFGELDSVEVPAASDPTDGPVMRVVADRAVGLVGARLCGVDRDGVAFSSTLSERDVAVVVSHNAQVSAVGAMLRAAGCAEVTVGTADRLQGGQWHAVVALDPLVGHESASPHALSSGRLCVMASRHATHLTWVHDGGWRSVLDGDNDLGRTAGGRAARVVREALTGGELVPVQEGGSVGLF